MPSVFARVSQAAGIHRYALRILVGFAALSSVGTGRAQTIGFSFSGIVTPTLQNIDSCEFFGGGSLLGDAFQFTVLYNEQGLTSEGGYNWEPNKAGALTTTLTINGITRTLSDGADGAGAFNPSGISFQQNTEFFETYGDWSRGDTVYEQLGAQFQTSGISNNLSKPLLPTPGGYVYFEIIAPAMGENQCADSLGGVAGNISIIDPFLLDTTKLGDLDLNTILPNQTTLDSATALAADGTSAAIVLFQVPTMDPVTFTTNNGTTLVGYRGNFLQKAPIPGNTTLKVTPIPIGSLIYAVALLQAPPAIVTPNFATPITITAQQDGGQMQQAYLPLVPPPVVLVHGIWGNEKSLKYYYAQLMGSGSIYSSQPAPYILPIKYTNDVAFNDPGVRSGPATLSRTIDGLLKSANSAGIVVGRADVVAHSMGGLVARAFSGLPDYMSLHNRGEGAIHQIITLDTPEQGSALASFLLQPSILNATYQNQDMGEEPLVWIGACGIYDVTVETCFADMKPTPLNITEGAVGSLVPGNQDLNEAPGPAIPNTIWNAVSAVVPQTGGNGENALEIELQDLIAGTYLHTSLAPTIAEILTDSGQDDAVVPVSSQVNGGPAQSVEVAGLGHIPAPSASALKAIHLYFHHSLADNGNVEESSSIASLLQCWLLTNGASSCNPRAQIAENAPRSNEGRPLLIADHEGNVDVPKFTVHFPAALHLATPFKLPISLAESSLATSIIVYQTDELRHNAEPQELPLQHDAEGRSYVTVIPTLLGSVTFTVEAAFLGGHWFRKDIVASVGMPANPPLKFRGDENFRQIVLREGGPGGAIDPVAFYGIPDQNKPIEISLSGRVECRVGSGDTDVILLHSDCSFDALSAGKATIEVAYGSIVDNVEVLVMAKDEW